MQTTGLGAEHAVPVAVVQTRMLEQFGTNMHCPTVAGDYAYLGEAQGDHAETQCPILVLKSGCDCWLSAEVCLAKGVQNEWCAKRVVAELMMVPRKRFTLKYDQEPAISASKTATGKEMVMGDFAVEESHANGLAEGVVKEPKGVIRSLRWTSEQLLGVVRFRKQERQEASLIGRLPPFAEKVLLLKAGKPKSCLENR